MNSSSDHRAEHAPHQPAMIFLESLEPRLLLSADNGLRAVYFDNIDLTGAKLCRTDTTVNFDWSSGSPDAMRIANDTFLARWTGKIKAANQSGIYTFYLDTESYDGVQLKINGKTIIDNWATPDGSTSRSGSHTMDANQTYDIQVDYKENTGNAKAILSWSYGSQSKQVIPTAQLLLGEQGLRADYFDDSTLAASSWKLTRNEAVNFDWGAGSPSNAIAPEGFSVRWSGQIIPQYTETYTIKAYVDEGARLWVNGTLLQDTWSAGGNVSGTVSLTAGTPASIILEYKDTTGNASARLVWSSASLAETTINDTQMYPYLPSATIMPNGASTTNKASTSLGGQYSYDSAADTYTFIGSWENLNTAIAGSLVLHSPNSNYVGGVYQQVDDITVKIEHSTLRTVTNGISWGGGSFLRVAVTNSNGYGLNPNVLGLSNGYFVSLGDVDQVTITNNTTEQFGAVKINNGGPNHAANPTFIVNHNSAKNIDGRKSDGNGGYLDYMSRTPIGGGTAEYGKNIRQFLQFIGCHNLVDTEIAWNQIVNEVGKSMVEDNINMFLSGGTDSSPILIHDNYIHGAYSLKPWVTGTTSDANYTYEWGYAGSGLLLGDGSTDVLANACGHIKAYNNQIIDTRKGISIASGHDIEAYDNHLISCGYLPDGQYNATQTTALSIYDGYGDAARGTMFNVTAHDNTIGWMHRSDSPKASVMLYNDKMAVGVGWFRDINGINYNGTTTHPNFTWTQSKFVMNFAANGGQGSGSLYYRTDTDHDGDFEDEAWLEEAGMQNLNLGFSAGKGAPNLNLRIRSDDVWAVIDDVMLTKTNPGDKLNINFESPTYILNVPWAKDGSDNNPAGQDGWTSLTTGQTGGNIVSTLLSNPLDPLSGKSGSQVAGGAYAWKSASYGFTGMETNVTLTFFTRWGKDGRNETWLSMPGSGYGCSLTNTTSIADTLTLAMEADQYAVWQNKLTANGKTIGRHDSLPTQTSDVRVWIDFESPTYVAGALVGQQGWTYVANNNGSILITPAAKAGSQVATGSINAYKNIAYGFTGDESNVQLSFFGYSSDNYTGPRVSLYNDNMSFYVVPRATIRNASGVTTTGDSHAPNTWFQELVVMDFTANSGQGGATVYTRTDLNGNGLFDDEAWVIDSVLQNVNLGLSTDPMNGRDPQNWNSMRLRIDGSQGYCDDIQLTVGSTDVIRVQKFSSDFESPTYTNNTQLVGQDGWTYVAGYGMVSTSIAGKWGNQMAIGQVNAWKSAALNLPTTGIAEVLFFGRSGDNYCGPRISLFNDHVAFAVVPRAYVRDASGNYTYGDAHPANTWVQCRVLIDLAANNHHGAVTLYTRTDTDSDGDFADELWIVDSVLQNIDLGSASNPGSWNSLRLRIDGANGQCDDIAVNLLLGATSIDQAQNMR